jgi:hypothetical protein
MAQDRYSPLMIFVFFTRLDLSRTNAERQSDRRDPKTTRNDGKEFQAIPPVNQGTH